MGGLAVKKSRTEGGGQSGLNTTEAKNGSVSWEEGELSSVSSTIGRQRQGTGDRGQEEIEDRDGRRQRVSLWMHSDTKPLMSKSASVVSLTLVIL